jgi:hypothetical protein
MALAPLLLLCRTALAAEEKLVACRWEDVSKQVAMRPYMRCFALFIAKLWHVLSVQQVSIAGFFVTESLQGIIRKRPQIGLELLGREDGFESSGNVLLQFCHGCLKLGVIQTSFFGNTGPERRRCIAKCPFNRPLFDRVKSFDPCPSYLNTARRFGRKGELRSGQRR